MPPGCRGLPLGTGWRARGAQQWGPEGMVAVPSLHLQDLGEVMTTQESTRARGCVA